MKKTLLFFVFPVCLVGSCCANNVVEELENNVLTRSTVVATAVRSTGQRGVVTETDDYDLVKRAIATKAPIMVLGYRDNVGTSNVLRKMAKSACSRIFYRYKDKNFQAFFIDVDVCTNACVKNPGELVFFDRGKEVVSKSVKSAQIVPSKKLMLEIEKALNLGTSYAEQDAQELKEEAEKLEAEEQQNQSNSGRKKLINKRGKKKRGLQSLAAPEMSPELASAATVYNLARQVDSRN